MTDISASGAGNRAREGSLFKKTVLPNTFYLTSRHEIAFLNSMTTETVKKKARWCWRKDLAEFRGLTDRERTGFLFVLEWFENRVFSVPGGGISQEASLRAKDFLNFHGSQAANLLIS